MVPGIDFAGTVVNSSDDRYKAGDKVVATGWGMSESHWGGYAERMRVPSRFLSPLPQGMSSRDAMIMGTAGFTAMLCVLALEKAGVSPDDGEIIVTGAAGGVGSVAVMLLAQAGYTVAASTGRPAEADYLKALGASEIVDRNTLSEKGRPMAKERWAGAVDTVGSHTLANVLAATKYGGTVTACGLAQSPDLPATVMPFILRNVNLQGIDSVMAPQAARDAAWAALADRIDFSALGEVASEVGLEAMLEIGPKILAGQVRGRTVVNVNA
jgi:acrylyl-CoA reductase (NADPH)